jgi:hypothetical protein
VLSAALPALLLLLLLLLLLQVVVSCPQPQEAWQHVVRAGGLWQGAVTPALTVTGRVRLDEATTTAPPSTTSRPRGCSGASCTSCIGSICISIVVFAAVII